MQGRSHRPRLPVVSDEMKAWSAALGSEIGGWPQVSTRPFFGLTALYRKDRIFALLPRTRGMESANSLAFKLDSSTATVRARLEDDRHISSAELGKTRWFTLELSSASDLHIALDWLGLAYKAAGRKKNSR